MKADNSTPLQLQHTYAASVTSLFDSWTLPSVASLWLYQNADTNPVYIADFKEGGEFHTVDSEHHDAVSHRGSFIRIDRPHTLIFTLAVPDHFDGESEVEVNFMEDDAGCHLKFIQRNADTSQNEKPWQDMLSHLEKILAAPYTTTIKSSAEEILTSINVVLMQLTGFLISLPESKVNTVPFKDSWTAGQLVCHITKSITGIASLIGTDGKPATRNITERVLELKQTFLDITIKMKSPDGIVPEQKKYEKENLIADLQDTLKKLRHAGSLKAPGEILQAGPLGEITRLELLHFVLYHSQRHLIQMKKICDAVMSMD